MIEELSAQQNEAVEKVSRWRQTLKRQYFLLDGPAGTGKTTLARLLSSSGVVLYAAPTGKAAAVLTSKGCPASTIHQLIYKPMAEAKSKLEELKKEEKDILQQLEEAVGPQEPIQAELRTVREKIRVEQKSADRPFFALRTESDLREADLLVVDERSMVDGVMGEDILSFHAPVLFLGDPYQLPPVNGVPFAKDQKPDFLLTEVHRQALGSPILELATLARTGGQLDIGYERSSDAGTARILGGRPPVDLVGKADQILCGRNATRIALNRRSREIRGFTDVMPVTGDRLVCRRNNHELGLANGTIWTVVKNHGSHMTGRIILDIVSEDGVVLSGVNVHSNPFAGRQVERWEVRDADMFEYGYALTVHNAQGSQWDSVVLFDDWNLQDRRKWLYTGITRAARELTIVQ